MRTRAGEHADESALRFGGGQIERLRTRAGWIVAAALRLTRRRPGLTRGPRRRLAMTGIAKRRLARPAAAASAAADSESEAQGRHRVVTKLEPQSHIYLPESYHSDFLFYPGQSSQT